MEGERGWRWTAKYSFLMFFILLQGSFHQFVWGLMLTGLIGLFHWKYFKPVLVALVSTCLLSLVRLLPPALLLGQFDNEFLSGYPSLLEVFTALLVPRGPQDAFINKSILTSLGWWEFDLYIGVLGAAFLIGFGLIQWVKKINTPGLFRELFLPSVLLFVLSMGRIYRAVMLLPVPLVNGERVSARILSLVFVILLLVAAVNLNRWLADRKLPSASGWAVAGLLVVLMSDLWQNLKLWRVDVAVQYFPKTPVDLAIKVVSNHADTIYMTTLVVGSVVTLITAVSLLLASRFSNVPNETDIH
jgi:hypothetical protein